MILSHDEYLKLPVITLNGLQDYSPADYSTLQILLQPHLEQIQTFWWICFTATLLFLLTRYFILPLIANNRLKLDLSCPPITTETSTPTTDDPGNGWLSRIKSNYIKIFSIKEIEQDLALRLYGAAILIGYLVTFEYWQMDIGTTIEGIEKHRSICWPFFQSCRDWIWMQTLPSGYSQTIFFMVLFGLIFLAAYGLLMRRIVLAHACILVMFIAKIYLMLTDFSHNGNYDYYHNLFNIVFLFLPQKRFFGSLMVVWFYFLSTASKIHPSWTWGGYFSSMRDGLPMIPRGLEPIFTNFIIFMEMLMAWFMFSSKKILQRSVFAFFCFFHIYSGTLVGYHYPTIVMPSLVIFFGTLFRPFNGVPLSKAALPGWIVIASLLGIQMFSHTLPGDTKLTLEGDFYGLYMFEANHQCRVTYSDENGKFLRTQDSIVARDRCNPWQFLTRGQQTYCAKDPNRMVKFQELHSVNGGPFYEIVNENDMCHLTYKPFSRNTWIKDETTAPIVGRPAENFYR